MAGVLAASMLLGPRQVPTAVWLAVLLFGVGTVGLGGRVAAAARRERLGTALSCHAATLDAVAWVAAFAIAAICGALVAASMSPFELRELDSGVVVGQSGPPPGLSGFAAFACAVGVLSALTTTLRLSRDRVSTSAVGTAFTAVTWAVASGLACVIASLGLAYAGAFADPLGTGPGTVNFAEPIAIVVLNMIVGAIGGMGAGELAEGALRMATTVDGRT
jgi:hypothetical protein